MPATDVDVVPVDADEEEPEPAMRDNTIVRWLGVVTHGRGYRDNHSRWPCQLDGQR